MDYRKLNKCTLIDHFPMSFMDQTLNRLAGKGLYYFLYGYSGYSRYQLLQKIKEKTTLICPYATFVFKRMSLGLCNEPRNL